MKHDKKKQWLSIGLLTLGAAALAGLAVGFWQSMDEVRALRVSDRVFSPERAQAECDEKYRLWKRAVSCACGWIEKA